VCPTISITGKEMLTYEIKIIDSELGSGKMEKIFKDRRTIWEYLIFLKGRNGGRGNGGDL